MNIVISHISALQFWRSNHPLAKGRPAMSRLSALPNARPSDNEIAKLNLEDFEIDARPLHILTTKELAKKSTSQCICHIYEKPLPRNSLVRLAKNIFVVSPEMCFVQMASEYNLARLVEFGLELCGTYARLPDKDLEPDQKKPPNMRKRPQLTTPAQLQSFVEQSAGVHGVKEARRALRFIVENSASPIETLLFILLCFPCCLGGYGLPIPICNQYIALTRAERIRAGKNHFRCDLCWPRIKLAVEYDSNEFHSGAEQITADSTRLNILQSKGFRVIPVTWGHVRSQRQLDVIAHIIAGALGHRVRKPSVEVLAKRRKLRATLLAHH